MLTATIVEDRPAVPPAADDALQDTCGVGRSVSVAFAEEVETAPETLPSQAAAAVAEVAQEFCQPLRVKYRSPWEEEQVNEEVYIDPQDEWDGGSGALLVSMGALGALKRRSALQYRYHEDALLQLERSRRDYLREQTYLLDQLSRMEHDADFQIAQEIRRLVENANEARVKASHDPVSVLGSAEDVLALACNVGARDPEDKELEEMLHRCGLSTDDELTTRLLLREMRVKVEAAVAERERLRKIYAPLEGMERTNVSEAMTSAINEENVPLEDALFVMLDMDRTEKGRNAINDAVTDNVRLRHEKALQQEQNMESEIMKFRERMAYEESLAGRALALVEEIDHERLHQEELVEIMERRRQQHEAEQEALMQKELANLMTEDDPLVLQEARVRSIEEESAEMQRDVTAMENQVEKDQAERNALRERFAEAQHIIDNIGGLEEAARSRSKAAAKDAEQWTEQHLAEKALAGALSDEYTAAITPPPNLKELYKVEHEIEEARFKTTEIRAEEANMLLREQHYRRKVERAQEAWELHEAEMREAEERRKEELLAEKKAQMSKSKRKIRLHEDPHMMPYRDRHEHPSYADGGVDRFEMLHDNARAREKRKSIKVENHLTVVASKILLSHAASRPDLSIGPCDSTGTADASEELDPSASTIGLQGAGADGNIVPPHVAPLTFRRPEDLRVRRKGFQLSANATTERLQDYQAEAGAAAEKLLKTEKQICSSIAKTLQTQSEFSSSLRPAERTVYQDDGQHDTFAALERELSLALAAHETSLSSAEEAWRLTEQFCMECGRVPGFNTLMRVPVEEKASQHEDGALAKSIHRVYKSASRVLEADAAATQANAGTSVSPEGLVTWARRCCTTYQASDLVLSAAKTSRQSSWNGLGLLSRELIQNMEVQESLELLRDAQHANLELLEQELEAPPDQKRALASMRASIRQDPLGTGVLRGFRPPQTAARVAPDTLAGSSVQLKERRTLTSDGKKK